MDLAPVLDVHSNPANPVIGDRSFGTLPSVVADMGTAFVRAMQGEGVAACAKHYPGHGDTSVDSHKNLPIVPHPLERLRRVELAPFRAACSADIAAIMASHVCVPALQLGGANDTGRPASMSRGALQVLRQDLAFRGVVLSDDMEMGAITKHFTLREAVVEGLLSGIDMFLVCHTEAKQHEAIDAIKDGVKAGRIPYARVMQANQRVDQLMQAYVTVPARIAETAGASSVTDANPRTVADAIPAGSTELGPCDLADGAGVLGALQLVGCRDHKAVIRNVLQQSFMRTCHRLGHRRTWRTSHHLRNSPGAAV
eukprot:jgi/Mesvir1/10482/Mv07863-RA.1